MKIQKAALVFVTILLSSMLLLAATNVEQNAPQNADYTLTGAVIDAETSEGVVGAEVTIKENEQSTTTDEYGTFSFLELEEGTYTVSVSADNYEDSETEVEIDGEGTTVQIEVVPEDRK